MHDSARSRTGFVEGAVQEDLLRRPVTGNMAPLMIQLADHGRIQKPQAGVGRRDEKAIADPNADIAR
jgi:hypothetical protein